MAEQANTAAILLGASSFPNYDGYAHSPAFLLSKQGFRSYLQDSDNGLNLPDEAILDLFDSHHNATNQLFSIGKFLDRASKETDPEVSRNLILYYVGHGYFPGQRQEYHVALASLTTGYESTTGLKLTELADVIKDKGRGFRRFVFLDCCFAAEALPDFMGAADDAMATKAQAAFAEDTPKRPVEVPRRGTALFCAADKDHVALSPATLKRTMFSDALLEALANGDEHIPTDLSLADVRDLTWERLQRHSPPVRPVLHSPDQTQGDIAKSVLLFPNAGRRMATEKADAAAKQEAKARTMRQAEEDKLKAEHDQRIRQDAVEREKISEHQEAELWQEALRKGTIAAYQAYLDTSARLTFRQSAEESIAALTEAARRLADRQAAEAEAQRKAAEKEAEERGELALWQAAQKKNTLTGYLNYLSASRYKSYQQAAEERIMELGEAARRLAEKETAEAESEAEAQGKAATVPKVGYSLNSRRLGLGVLAAVTVGILWVVLSKSPEPIELPEPAPAPVAAPAAEVPPAPPNYAPKQVFQDAFLDGSGQGPKMVVIPAGSFLMGSPDGKNGTMKEEGRSDDEGPQHSVSVPKFALAQTEVTLGQFRAFVAGTGYRTDAEENRGGTTGCYALKGDKWDWRAGLSWKKPGFAQGEDHPVVCVSWNDSRKYVEWLSRKTGQRYALPSEAQWEYAARGGTSTVRFWGEKPSEACAYANVADQGDSPDGKQTWSVPHECRDGYWFTAPTGHFKPNAFGLYDMIGNVWEWVQDNWHDSYKEAPSDGGAWQDGNDVGRVLRGGSWYFEPQNARSAFRGRNEPAYRGFSSGLRPARMLP